MNKIEALEWKAEKYSLGRAMTAAKADGTVLKVADVEPAHEGAVGYTSRDKIIHLAYEHEIMDGLDKNHKRAFRMGVCTHELMHQILTDFVILERNVVGLPSYEQRIFAELNNIIEDARIEHYAYQFVGGALLSSLKFAIAHTYKIAHPLEECPNALTQFMNALVMYGDLGPLIGHFTFPEAKDAFMKSAELFDAGIHEVSPRKVIKITKQIFEIARPLWQDEADMAKLMESMAEELQKMGKTASSGSGKPSGMASDDSDEDDSAESKRRKSTVRKVSRKEYEEAMKNGSKGGKGSGSGEKLVCEDTKTAEEAAEAAKDARENAKEAKQSAKEARKSAKEMSKNGSSPAKAANAENAANRAESAAERAEEAAKNAEAAAKAANAAKKSGDSEGEEANAKNAGKEALKAANAAKNAAKAADAAAGNSSGGGSNDAEGAAESAAEAAASAQEAAEAAEQAENGSEGESSGNGSGGSKSKAEKAREAAERAKEAAAEAAEAAKNAADAANDGDAEGESANARAAARAAAKAKAAARAAERAAKAANGESTDSGEEAHESQLGDVNGDVGSNADTDYSERCIDGARPDYSNASYGESEEFDGEATEFDMEEYEISEEDLSAIEREVESCVNDVKRAEMESAEDGSTPLPDFDIAVSRVKDATSCLNVRVKAGDDPQRLAESYSRIIAKLKPGIDSLTGQLRRIFQDDVEEKDYRYSGKINMKRLHSGRKTARVFDRRRLPAEKSDVIVELLVDESGSMSGSRAEHAKQAAIALAEVMNNLKIPVYVIGFTADTSGYDCVHNHYITWKNTKADRLKLLNITARCDNFDGYSIRYGGEILKKKNAKHKLMIVISDGSPACYSYCGADGIPDTKDAIRDVRKEASVLGVAIGNNDTKELHYMYGKDFIHISNMDDLFTGISKKMAKIIDSWE